MQSLTVFSHSLQPPGERGIFMSGVTHQHRPIHPLGQKPQHHFHPVRFRLEIVQRRAFATAEHRLTALAAQIGNVPILAAQGVPDQGVDRFLGNPEIRTRRIQTCPALRRVLLLPSALALHFTPGCHRVIDPHAFQMYSPAAVRTVFRRFRMPLHRQMIFDPLPPPFHLPPVQPPPQTRHSTPT